MLSADSRPSLGHSPMSPYSLVAITVFSRRPPPWLNQRPTISSVAPRPLERPYTLAESKKLIPASNPASMIENEVGSSVSGPKFMVPRQMRLTVRPVRPRCV